MSLRPFHSAAPRGWAWATGGGGGLEEKDPSLSTLWQPSRQPAGAQSITKGREEDVVTYPSVAPSFSKRPMEGAARHPGG